MELAFIKIRKETPTVATFVFQKPPHFFFRSGQYLSITIGTEARQFSISSSPSENDLEITTRLREPIGKFKEVLVSLKEGQKVEAAGPMGKFLLQDNLGAPAVMICGGIGITPLRSMIKFAYDNDEQVPITLIYSNRTEDEILFHSELEAIQKKTVYFKVNYVLTRTEDWDGEKGHISVEMIRRLVPELSTPNFYVAGPPTMVDNVLAILNELRISPSRIRFERFAGY